jgi:hypothetical protein
MMSNLLDNSIQTNLKELGYDLEINWYKCFKNKHPLINKGTSD